MQMSRVAEMVKGEGVCADGGMTVVSLEFSFPARS